MEFRLRTVITYFFLLTILVYGGVLFGKQSFFATDITTQNLGYRHWAADTLKHGELPVWCPRMFAGYPVLAETQAGIFYPLFVLFLIFPVVYAYNVFVAGQYFLAGIFLYLWLRSRSISSQAALIVSTGYFFSSLLINFHVYCNDLSAAIWLPLILAASTFFQSRKGTGFVWVSLLFCIQIFAGHSQFVWNTILMGALLDAFTLQGGLKNKCKHILLFWIVAPLSGAALASVQVLPTLEFLQNSQRASMDYAYATTPSYQLRFLSQAFLPNSFGNLENLTYSVAGPPTLEEMMNAFIGMVNLFFALYALVSRKANHRLALLGIAGIGIFLSLGSHNPVFYWIHRLPVFSFFRYPNRYLVLTTFSFLLLAGKGVDAFQQEDSRKPLLFLTAVLCVLGICISWFASRPILEQPVSVPEKLQLLGQIRLRDLLIALMMVAFTTSTALLKNKHRWKILVALSIVGGSFLGYRLPPTMRAAAMTTPPEPAKFLQSAPPGRMDSFYEPYIEDNLYSRYQRLQDKYARMRALISGDSPLLWNLSSIRGIYHPLIPRYYYETLQVGQPWSVPVVFYRLLGLRYFLTDQPLQWQLASYPMETIGTAGDIRIYGSLGEPSRARLVHRWRLATGPHDFNFDPDTEGLIHSAAEITQQPQSVNAQDDRVSITADANRFVRLDTDSHSGGLMILSDIYYPGWTATIDGSAAKIHRVDHLFRGVFVSSGHHTIQFQYESTMVKIGAACSAIAAILIAIAFLFFRRGEAA